MSGASVSLFSVTFCRQIIPNSVFLSATEDKIKQQHHLFVLARSSFKRDAKHGETQKGRTPRRAISAKTERTHDAPGLLKARPQFYLLPCYFCIRARFFFFFVLRKMSCCLCVLIQHWTAHDKGTQQLEGCVERTNWLHPKKMRLKVQAKFETVVKIKQLDLTRIPHPLLPVAGQHEQKATSKF